MTHPLFELLRYPNAAMAMFVGVHLIITTRISWAAGRPHVRLMRIGTGLVLLTTAYASVTGIISNRPATTFTAPFLFVGLLWCAVGTVWTIHIERAERKGRS